MLTWMEQLLQMPLMWYVVQHVIVGSSREGGTWCPASSSLFMMNHRGLSQRSGITAYRTTTYWLLTTMVFGTAFAASPWCQPLWHVSVAGAETLDGGAMGMAAAPLGTASYPEYIDPSLEAVESIPVMRKPARSEVAMMNPQGKVDSHAPWLSIFSQ